jgi:hypothetical protein
MAMLLNTTSRCWFKSLDWLGLLESKVGKMFNVVVSIVSTQWFWTSTMRSATNTPGIIVKQDNSCAWPLDIKGHTAPLTMERDSVAKRGAYSEEWSLSWLDSAGHTYLIQGPGFA